MTCKECEKYLAFYPGELDPGVNQAIAMHISHCEKCQALYNSLTLYRDYASESPAIKPPDIA